MSRVRPPSPASTNDPVPRGAGSCCFVQFVGDFWGFCSRISVASCPARSPPALRACATTGGVVRLKHCAGTARVGVDSVAGGRSWSHVRQLGEFRPPRGEGVRRCKPRPSSARRHGAPTPGLIAGPPGSPHVRWRRFPHSGEVGEGRVNTVGAFGLARCRRSSVRGGLVSIRTLIHRSSRISDRRSRA